MSDHFDEVLITARAAPARRAIASVILTALGILLILVAMDDAMQFGWRVAYLAFGSGAVYGSYRLWQATGDVLELTRYELRTGSGQQLAAIADIDSVDRGAFAFKPSNGFVIRLKSAEAKRGWAPGLWWRIGKRIGVGGVVSAGQAKGMAEVLTALVAGIYPDPPE